ncbi:PI31 proteasome regulator N-terminal-domain-containing protein [Lentinula edodes]|uniref:PI31 proteasome regulator N-terminal-domain-containing protein n=1 Tax=Lentinula edodes TaxID=5353 RepID=UPI001E8D1DFA|nr:PI31 proteasome regulator N-terminal-domain-containing protein [Lentinula edodes]KAH7879641.1 PI31 proteasome regulator N-terminal-domain-containing protein [Lentinula edodes]
MFPRMRVIPILVITSTRSFLLLTAMANILDASALTSLIPTLLPPNQKSLQSPQDALAVLSHAILSSLAFRLIAVDDSNNNNEINSNSLPENWNSHGPGGYTFRYKHEQSSLEFVVKLTKLGKRTVVNAIAVESDKTSTLDISTDDFTSPSSFPYILNTDTNSSSSSSPLVHCYISSSRITDFVSQFKLKIIQKLVPGLRKDGYTEEVDLDDKSSTSTTNNTHSLNPVRPGPSRTIPRYNPDEEEFPMRFPPTRNPSSHIAPNNPLEIGRRDLDPIPGGSFQPPPLFPQSGSGDGMFVGPDHPIFGGRIGQGQGSGGGFGPGIGGGGIGGIGGRGPRWGGDGFLPPMGAPPGARFDPVGPMFGPGPGGVGIGLFPGGGVSGIGSSGTGRRPHNLPGQGDPDNDEFMPPGAENMYM